MSEYAACARDARECFLDEHGECAVCGLHRCVCELRNRLSGFVHRPLQPVLALLRAPATRKAGHAPMVDLMSLDRPATAEEIQGAGLG